MEAYAYLHTADYGDTIELFPSLFDAIVYAKNHKIRPDKFWLEAHFPNRTKNRVDISWLVESGWALIQEVNLEEVTKRVDKNRQESEEYWGQLTGHGTVTGCAPYHLGNREQQIRDEIEKNMYDWR